MHAQFIQLKDPFRPTINRVNGVALPGHSIRRTLKGKKLIVNGKRIAPFIVIVNGKCVLEKDWRIKVRDNDVIVVQHLPKGGGGSNPLQIVAMIALVVASAFIPGALGITTPWLAAAASASVMIGGSLLLNMMFKQNSPSVGTTSNADQSPTYTVAAQGNSARLLQAIPVVYGRLMWYPDYAAAPYTEIQNGEQYLYQLLCLTQGEISLEKVMINGADISTYDGAQMELVQPYQPVTLFPTNVDTSTAVASQILYGPNNASYAKLGPFITNTASSTANFLSVDISVPGGLFKLNDNGSLGNATIQYGFDYQAIDANGNGVGSVMTLVTNTITAANRDAIRLTHKVAVPDGRYQVWGYRVNNQGTDTTTSDQLQWDALRAYLTDNSNFGNVTLLAVIVKATNQLSNASTSKLQVIGTRKLQTWDPVNGWTVGTSATQNPAWAAADILRQPDYGRNLPDSRYNINTLYALAQTFAARGDTFNYVFDTTSTLWDALKLCLKVGRTVPMYYAGLIEFIRNEPRSAITAMFQPSNMTKNSFSTTYQFAEVDTPDYVTIQFNNEDNNFEQDTVDCVLPGGTQNVQSTVTLDGCTNRDQAWREGITMAAINKLQRRIISFTTELEGYIPQYSDLCQISHDVVGWGYSGRVKSLDVNTGICTLSEPVVFTPGSSYVIAFRKRNGSPDGPYTVTQSTRGIANEVIVAGTATSRAAIYISNGVREEFTAYQFGAVSRAGLLAQAFSSTPQGDGTVQMSFVNYDPNIFVAETGGIVPDPTPISTLPTQPVLPTIDSVTLQYTFTVGLQTIVATPADGAQYYEFRVSPDNGQTWIALGTSVNPSMNVQLNVGTWYVSVRAVGLLKGPWTTVVEQVVATTLPLVAIGTFTTTGIVFGIRLDWTIKTGNGGIADHVEIWTSTANALGGATLLGTFPKNTNTYNHQNDMGPGEVHYYWIRVIDTAGRQGPWFNNGVGTVGQSSSDIGAIIDYLGGEIDETMLSQDLQTKINNGAAGYAQANATVTDLAAMYTIKTQLTVDGQTYIAGIGVGVENDSGVVQPQVLVAASRFAVLDPNAAGTTKYPFIISGGAVYMDSAFIQNASITNAKIGGVLQSNLVNSQGQPTWAFDKDGLASFNGYGGGNARLTISNNQILLYDSSGNLAIEISTSLSGT